MAPPIRKADGTVIEPQGIQQVRKGDGTVLFNTIPDSVVHQYRVEEFADPWPANVGPVDMSVAGLTPSTFNNGRESVLSDGTDDEGLADGPQTLPTNETFGLAFTFEAESANLSAFEKWEGIRSTGSGSEIFAIQTRNGDGDIEMQLRDDNSNLLTVNTTASYADGTPKAVVINKSGNTASDIDIYINDMSNPDNNIRDDQSFDHTNFSTSLNMGFFAENTNGGLVNRLNTHIGVFEFNTAPYNRIEREAFVSRRPEV